MAKKAKVKLKSWYVKSKTVKLKDKWEVVEKEPILVIDKSVKKKKLWHTLNLKK